MPPDQVHPVNPHDNVQSAWCRQQGGSHPHGQDAVGLRIGIYWPGDGCFYSGTVSSFDEPSGCHCVAYDDNENDWLVLAVSLMAPCACFELVDLLGSHM